VRIPVRLLAAAILGSWLIVADAPAKTLPLPENLISLNSAEGEHLLLQSNARQSYWNLSIQFLTQRTQSFCGVASIVMVLNALGTPAPTTPEYDPYTVFTQDDFLNDRTEKVLPQAVLAKKGMTLDQIGQLLGSYGVHAEVHHAADATLDEFRTSAIEHMSKPGGYVIVNYLRRSIGQERGGHISPLGAYDAGTDRFLILDVARYKYPPVWVKAKELFDAMNTTDSDNDNRTRGYVLIRASP
jgi:hypothetical protein